jgi:crossover junction endodeoxyribonuclease RusA
VTALEFTVWGDPVPQGSKTFVNAGGKPRARESNEKRLAPWRGWVASAGFDAMKGGDLLLGPLSLHVVFVLKRPKGHYGTGRNAGTVKPSAPAYVQTKPDADKLVRAIGDALTGIVYRDDSQLVVVHVEKHYGEPACAHVRIEPVELGEAL